MKPCSVCGIEKSADEFQKRLASKDGLSAACKCCLSIRDKNRENEHRAEQRRIYQATHGTAAHTAANRRYRQRNKNKLAAHNAVARAIASGQLIRLPCLVCGEVAEAHHPDYDRPLDVIWLCDKHHKEAHAIVRLYKWKEAA